MRPRFSLKWLLIAFTILAAAFYLAFVRPTVLANQFVSLVEAGELQRAESLMFSPDKPFKDDAMENEPVLVAARLQPRTWSNLYKMQRELELRVIRTRAYGKGQSGNLIGQTSRPIAGVFGIRDGQKYRVTFAQKYLDKLLFKRERRAK